VGNTDKEGRIAEFKKKKAMKRKIEMVSLAPLS
jgi:hypothetical protein